MATQQGHLSEFDSATGKIDAYFKWVDIFFITNNTADEKQVAILLNVIGGKTHTLLQDLVTPALPSTKMLAELKQVLKDHFELKPIIVVERFFFHQRSQNLTGTIAEYVAELRRLTKCCEFGQFLEESF